MSADQKDSDVEWRAAPETPGFGGRAGPITHQEFMAAIKSLEISGRRVSQRNVYDSIGHGSMSTIAKMLAAYRGATALKLPKFELSDTDRDVMVELCGNLFAISHNRIKEVAAEREAILLRRAEDAETEISQITAVADEAVAAAEARVAAAEEALDHVKAEAAAALLEKAAAKDHAMRLAGQMEQLAADRQAALDRLASTEDSLLRMEGKLDVEIAGRAAAEGATRAISVKLDEAQAAFDEKLTETAGQISTLQSSLAAQTALLSAMTEARVAEISHTGKIEAELVRARDALSVSQAEAISAKSLLGDRDTTISRLLTDLAAERARSASLSDALVKANTNTEALAALASRIEAANEAGRTARPDG